VSFTVYDMEDRRKQLTVVGGLATLVAASLLLFGVVLGWI
jgi:hypothetical protein